ncbi:MAG TPA: hypothetical protein VFB26_07575 [Gaiellaceae bacterium]|nr:hypothetical protein [Gaiellaceae bacterium]
MTGWPRVLHRRDLAYATVAIGVLAYPVGQLAGGLPHFPSRNDCVVPATHDGDIELVLGRFDSVVAASSARARFRTLGYTGAEVVGDGCGRVKVAVPGYPTLAGARDAAAEAARAGIHATLEQARP